MGLDASLVHGPYGGGDWAGEGAVHADVFCGFWNSVSEEYIAQVADAFKLSFLYTSRSYVEGIAPHHQLGLLQRRRQLGRDGGEGYGLPNLSEGFLVVCKEMVPGGGRLRGGRVGWVHCTNWSVEAA